MDLSLASRDVSNYLPQTVADPMEHMTHLPIMMLDNLDRETLLSRLRSGEISQHQFADQVADLGLEALTRRLQLHVPDLPSPDPDDRIGHVLNIFRFVNAI